MSKSKVETQEIILTATTSATQSSAFFVAADEIVSVMTTATLGAGETADIQYSPDEGTTWVDYIDSDAVELTETKNAVRLYGPCLYRVDKDATPGAAIGIVLHR